MPEIGDIARGKDVGKGNLYGKYYFSKCPECGVERWLYKYYLAKQIRKGLCQSCNMKQYRGDKGSRWKVGGKRLDGVIC